MAQSTPSMPADGVEMVGDISFGQPINESGQIETLRLDLYLPANDPSPLRPAVMWFHGGGFTFGNDKRQRYIARFANAFAAKGYVGIAPDYRLRANPAAGWPGALSDAVADARMAIEWVRVHAGEQRIDPRRIVLAGGSAGGLTVLSLVHDPQRPLHAQRDGICAVIDMSGTPSAQTPGFQQVNPNSPPTLIIHGTADALVPYQNSVDFAHALEKAGVEHVLLTLLDAPHTPLQHFEEMLAAIEQFLAKHAGKAN